MRVGWCVGIVVVVAAGCATKGGLRSVNEEVRHTQTQVKELATEAAMEHAFVDQMEAIRSMRAEFLAEMRAMNDAISVLNARLGDVQDRLFRLYRKMDTIQLYGVSRVPTSSSTTDSARSAPAARGASLDPQVLYDAAYADFLNAHYDLAISELSVYLTEFPEEDLADQARYWLAESHRARKEYQRAVEEFEKLMKEHPGSGKVPGALLGMGRALVKLKKTKTATSKFRELVKRFPDAPEVEQAQQELKALATRKAR